MTRSRLLPVTLALALAAGAAYAGNATVKIFEIYYTNASELKDVVASLLGPEGKVTVNTSSNSLIVIDEPEVLKQVARVISRLDRKPKNIRITVEFVEKSRLKELGIDVRWKAGGHGWSIGTYHAPSSGKNLEIGANASTASSHSVKKQSLLLMEDKRGRIFVGETVPFTEYYRQYGHNHGYISKNVKFKDAGTSFTVKARTIQKGSKIKITLEPEVSYYDREKKSFSVKNAATSIIISDPGMAVIGSQNDDSDSFNANFLRGVTGRKSGSSFVMILKVRSENLK